MNCKHCAAPAEHTLCFQCQGRLMDALKTLAWLYVQLQTDLTRTSRKGTSDRSPRTETPLMFDDQASECADLVRDTLSPWANDLGGSPFSSVVSTIAWMLGKVFELAKLPDAELLLDELAHCTERAYRIVDRHPGRTYLTDCGCGRRVYAGADVELVACACGQSFDVAAHKQAFAEQARDVLVTAKEAARTLGEVYGRQLSADTIYKWVQRGKLQPAAEGMYRLGDILDCQDKRRRVGAR